MKVSSMPVAQTKWLGRNISSNRERGGSGMRVTFLSSSKTNSSGQSPHLYGDVYPRDSVE
jgi:hypothetical protein